MLIEQLMADATPSLKTLPPVSDDLRDDKDYLAMLFLQELANSAPELVALVKAAELVACPHEWYLGKCVHCEMTASEYRAGVAGLPPADGMVSVPVEPTEEMIRAALDCQDHDPADPPESETYHLYKAMIAAAGK